MKGLRLACTAINRRIYVGKVNKAGDSFLDGTQDVSSDFFKAVIDRFSEGPEIIRGSSGDEYEVTVRKIK